MVTKFKKFESLVDNYLDNIYDRINMNDGTESLEIAASGSFRWFLEDNYSDKLQEYLYRISDGENIPTVIIDISKTLTRDGKLGEHLRTIIDAIFPKYTVTCIANPDAFDLDIGDEYIVVDEYVDEGRELIELEYNASGEPCTVYTKNLFSSKINI